MSIEPDVGLATLPRPACSRGVDNQRRTMSSGVGIARRRSRLLSHGRDVRRTACVEHHGTWKSHLTGTSIHSAEISGRGVALARVVPPGHADSRAKCDSPATSGGGEFFRGKGWTDGGVDFRTALDFHRRLKLDERGCVHSGVAIDGNCAALVAR